MYTVKYDKLPLVLCCIWYQVCRFRDYEKSGTIYTQEIMRHSSSIHNQFKSYTSGGNYSILSHLILPWNRLSPFFFFLLLCHTGNILQSGPVPSKWANQRLLIIYTFRRIFSLHYPGWMNCESRISRLQIQERLLVLLPGSNWLHMQPLKTNGELSRDTPWSLRPSVLRHLLWVTHRLKLMIHS